MQNFLKPLRTNKKIAKVVAAIALALVCFLIYMLVFKKDSPEQALLKEAYAQEEVFRYAVRKDLEALKKQLPKNPPQDLRGRVISRLQKDLEIGFALNAYLHDRKAHHKPKFEEGEITWSLKTNKLPILLTGAVSIVSEYFDELVDGRLVDRYLRELKSMPVLDHYDPKKKNYHGNSYASFLRVALYLVLMESGVKPQDLKIDDSAIFHTAPLPHAFDPAEVHPDFEEFSWFYQDSESPEQGELLFVHSGYSFGATRADIRCTASGKKAPPKDCSSWIQELFGLPILSTAHQLIAYNKKFGGFIPDDWESGSDMEEMEAALEPLQITYTRQIKPGYIYTYRSFKLDEDPTMTETLGAGGHVGIVTQVNHERKTVMVLSYSRSLPEWGPNGFGVMAYPALSIANKKVFYFKPKKSPVKS